MPAEIPVTIDGDFARFGSRSFAINKINTVDVEKRHPHRRDAAIVWAFFAALALVWLAGVGLKDANGGLALLAAAFCAWMAWRAWQRSKIVEYQLMLATSSGAVQAIKSRDAGFIFDTRRQIEAAIAGKLD